MTVLFSKNIHLTNAEHNFRRYNANDMFGDDLHMFHIKTPILNTLNQLAF